MRNKRTKGKKRRRLSHKTHGFFEGRRGVVAKTIITLLVLFALTLPAVFINNAIGYAPVLMFVLLIILSFLYLQILKRCISYEEMSSLGECMRGTDIDFIVRFKNKGPLLFLRLEPYFYLSDLFGEDDSITSECISLAPFEGYDFRFSVRFEHIGTYGAGLRKIVISDLLGLFTSTIHNENQYAIEVLPRIFDVTTLDFNKKILTETIESFTPAPLDGTDYSGVRDYVPGDPMKKIHWKLSARGDVYYTKLYETYGTPGIGIILDFHAPRYENEDMMHIFDTVVESGLSIADYARSQDMDFSLAFQNREGRHVNFNSHEIMSDQRMIISQMPRISNAEYGGVAHEILRIESNSLYSKSNIVLCTSTIDEQLINLLISIKNHRKNPLLIVIIPPSIDSDERKELLKPLHRLNASHIAYRVLSSTEQLEKGDA